MNIQYVPSANKSKNVITAFTVFECRTRTLARYDLEGADDVLFSEGSQFVLKIK